KQAAAAFDAAVTDDEMAARVGEQIAEVLRLRKREGRYVTTWGTKTPAGLARSVIRVIADQIGGAA
ncbi:MAG: hypothetical protein AB7I42_25945, partial [Bradyrhizobium sp.]|uniref:hypothetical protein n=1 Tax=Bradyrhizobium sp. TaxID=376 RepID=UPI003D0BC86A